MARIAGVDIPRDKRVVISLTYIYGIGKTTSQKVLAAAGIDENIRVRDLTEDQLNLIREQLDSYKTEGDLRREVSLNIKRLMEIASLRGIRHRRGFTLIRRMVLFMHHRQRITSHLAVCNNQSKSRKNSLTT